MEAVTNRQKTANSCNIQKPLMIINQLDAFWAKKFTEIRNLWY